MKAKNLSYTNKIGQKIVALYEYKEFDCKISKIMKGKMTLVKGEVNGKPLPPFYLDGHVDAARVKSAISR